MALDTREMRKRLIGRRAELEGLGAATEESRRPVELDQTRVGRLSRMDALQEQAMAVEVERRRAIEIQRIDAALARLDSGEYGYCVACGEPIATKRLELDPTIPNCIDCAKGAGG